jgi:hypothetical protein
MGRYLTAEEAEKEYLDAMGPDLGRLYSLLVDECSLLHLQWAEYKVLFGTSPGRIDLMNRAAPAFFSQLQNTLWEAIILHIARLMDPASSPGKGKENATLLRLSQLVDSAIQPKIDILLGVARAKCKFSQDWRNRHIAHRDLNLALNGNAKPLESVSRLNVQSSLEAIAAVLNVIESHYRDCGTVAYEHSIELLGGAKALLYLLRDGLDAHEDFERRQMSGKLLPGEMMHKRPL